MSDNPPPPRGERLQKILAAAGVASRRQCEELILAGRVEVDGQVVTELGRRADPEVNEIVVDGQRLKIPTRVYYAVNKPPGVVSTNRDPAGRARVIDLAPDDWRLFTVGRLDRSSEGLILVTNDGELANRLMHPRFGVAKTYLVEVAGEPTPEELAQLTRGVYLAEGRARVDEVKVKKKRSHSTLLEMVLREGKNREIRRVLAKVGHKVLRLARIAVGSVRLGELAPGSYRPLTREEVAALRSESEPGAAERRKAQPERRPRAAATPRADSSRERPPRAGAKPAVKPGAESGAKRSRPPAAPRGPSSPRGERPPSRTPRSRPPMKKKSAYRPPERVGSVIGADDDAPPPATGERPPAKSQRLYGKPVGKLGGKHPRAQQRPGKPTGAKPASGRPSGSKPSGGKPYTSKPRAGKPEGSKPPAGRPSGGKPSGGKPSGGKPSGGKPGGGKPSGGKPGAGKPGAAGRGKFAAKKKSQRRTRP